jgi:hypothetical protein
LNENSTNLLLLKVNKATQIFLKFSVNTKITIYSLKENVSLNNFFDEEDIIKVEYFFVVVW